MPQPGKLRALVARVQRGVTARDKGKWRALRLAPKLQRRGGNTELWQTPGLRLGPQRVCLVCVQSETYFCVREMEVQE